ncbi:g8852 [Coccomyxa viridis]|uniref:G8852 protein n=1 Tax=Coccomyxa viridis TaxID=1274662 RepID=A0ABP1G1E3_9CHLO
MPRLRAATGAASEAGPQQGAAIRDVSGKEKSSGGNDKENKAAVRKQRRDARSKDTNQGDAKEADVTPEPPTPAMLESIAAANSSLTEPASSAPGGKGCLMRGQGSVLGNLAALGRPEGSAHANDPSIADAAARLLSGKRKVTIEEIREALRKACAEARERDPEGVEAAAASAEAAPAAAKGRKRQQKASAGGAKPKKATPARKARRSVVPYIYWASRKAKQKLAAVVDADSEAEPAASDSDFEPDKEAEAESEDEGPTSDSELEEEEEEEEEEKPARKRVKTASLALVKKPVTKAKGGQSAKDALKAAAKQRRLEKQSAKPESPPWDNYNRKGREVAEKEIGESDEEESEVEELDVDLVEKARNMPFMEQPEEIMVPLLPYQRQFLAWGVSQEQSSVRGGILADEMGMGKTLQAIALIVTHRTDDMSKLPPVITTEVLKKLIQAAGPKRPKLAMLSAVRQKSATAVKQALSSLHDAGAPEVRDLDPAAPAAPSTLASQLPMASAEEGWPEEEEWVDVDDAGKSMEGSCASAEAGCCSHEAHTNTEAEAGPSGTDGPKAAYDERASGGYGRATLVICPLVAVLQWRQEIERFTNPETLKVVVFHGNKRTADPAELADADVVLTTYSIIEGEHRRYVEPDKIPCKYCSKRFQPDRLEVHLRFFCGPNAKKSAALAKQQKKRPRGDDKGKGKQAARGADSEEESAASDSDAEEAKEEAPAKRKKGIKGPAKGKGKGKSSAKGKGREKGKASKENAKGKGKAKAEEDSDSDSDFTSGDESSEDEDQDPNRRNKRRAWRSAWRAWRASKGETGIQDAASADAADMIARAKAKAKQLEGPGISVLHEVRWRRVVLDEAHSIKDRRCSTARAVFALTSKYKWALSGTPLQNRVGELYSLIRFLRIFPYAFYFCGAGTAKTSKIPPCDCRSLDHPFKKNHRKCDHCGHGSLSHYCWWNKHVANPIKKFGYVGKGRKAMLLLKQDILTKILLRRTKVQCADVLALPPRTVLLRKDAFDEREMDFYEALYTQSQAQFGAYVESGTVLNNYAHIFDLLIRLRQAVDHPYLVVYSTSGANAAAAQRALAATASASEAPAGAEDDILNGGMCGVCHDPLEQPVVAGCGHAFCRVCIGEYLDGCAEGSAACPCCQRPLSVNLTAVAPAAVKVANAKKSSILNRMKLAGFQSSTKIEALREELALMLAQDPSAKALVFSQFTSMLDLIYYRLQQVGIRCVRLEGSMSMEARDRMISAFTNEPGVTVFLMSLKAGGVALNLTAASHVMLMDPWWNPAVEQQAQDRIHRLGQFKPIHVTRFIIAGTIEERILKLQEKKRLVFEGTVGGSAESLAKLTEDDMKFLFS